MSVVTAPARASTGDMTALFDVVRALKEEWLAQAKNGPVFNRLTQPEVDRLNRALAGEIVSLAQTGMKATASAIALIHSFETLRLVSYEDPGSKNGLPITNGWGTTIEENGKPIALGVIWDREKADRLFARDLAAVENGVNTLLIGRNTTQAQFNALVSFAYNVGLDMNKNGKAEGLGDSTLLRKHLAGDFAGAAAEFPKWDKNDGKIMAGLVRRRKAERAMYEGMA